VARCAELVVKLKHHAQLDPASFTESGHGQLQDTETRVAVQA